MFKNLHKNERIKFGLLALVALTIISISPYFVGPEEFGITPIYVWLAANIGVHPFFVGILFLVLTWLVLGIFSAEVNRRLLILWNSTTTLVGLSWLVSSKDYIIPDFSTEYYIWCLIAFVFVQGSCWYFGFKFRADGEYARTRAICAILLSLNICWSLMPFYGIR